MDTQIEAIIKRRLNSLLDLIKSSDDTLDGMLVLSATSISYLTNFSGDEAQLLVLANGSIFLLSDSRFSSQIKTEVPDFIHVVVKTSDDVLEIAQILSRNTARRLQVEGDFITATGFDRLKDANPNIHFILATEIIEKLRLVKDNTELSLINEAIRIAETSFTKVLEQISNSMTELDVAALLEFEMKKNGATGPSFETIVASGVRSAWPHGAASSKKLANHELITIDFGAVYQGYVSDITRTIALGSVDTKLTEIYSIVLAANKAGIAASNRGALGQDVDIAARSIINDAGFGEYFGHGIGHGIGRDIHEINSKTMRFRNQKLSDNMVITVEPGIYLPDLGGVRIEDDVQIGAQPRVLTTLPKDELIIL